MLLRRVRERRKHSYRHTEERTDQVRVVHHKQVLEWQYRGGSTNESEQGTAVPIFSLLYNCNEYFRPI